MSREKYSIGDFQLEFDAGDLFRIYWREIEVIQRIYVAVRDESWNTIPGRMKNLKIVSDERALKFTFEMEHRYQEIDFAWTGIYEFNSDDTFRLSMSGKITQLFKYCKIGFNVHHGLATHRNRSFSIGTQDQRHEGHFGSELVPQLVKEGFLTAMTPVYDDLSIQFDDFIGHFTFAGDLFEMQDHRNWGDDNWKSYGTPLAKGFPFEAAIGEVISQEITFAVEQSSESSGRNSKDLTVQAECELPELGVCVRKPIATEELNKLQDLYLDHLRVDINFSSPNWDLFEFVVESARHLSCDIEIALFIPNEISTDNLRDFIAPIQRERKSIARILVFAEKGGYNPFQGATEPNLAESVKAIIDEDSSLPIFSGTDQFFSDLNRLRPDYSQIEGVVFGYNPQVHASDELSIMQNASPVVDIADYIRSIYGNKKIVISPVEFLGLGGPFPQGPVRADELPANVDPRMWSELGQRWTAAFLAHSSRAGINSLTLFEVSGMRGLFNSDGTETEIFTLLAEIADVRSRGMNLKQIEATKDNDEIALTFRSGDGLSSAVIRSALSGEKKRME